MRRRQVLVVGSTAAVGLAGCTTVRDRLGDVRRNPPDRRVDSDWDPEQGTWAKRDYGLQKRRHSPHATPPWTEPGIDWQHELDYSLGDGWLVVADDTVYGGVVDAETDGNDKDAAPGAVPMVFRRGRSVNSVLGPDADVFERDCGNEDD